MFCAFLVTLNRDADTDVDILRRMSYVPADQEKVNSERLYEVFHTPTPAPHTRILAGIDDSLTKFSEYLRNWLLLQHGVEGLGVTNACTYYSYQTSKRTIIDEAQSEHSSF